MASTDQYRLVLRTDRGALQSLKQGRVTMTTETHQCQQMMDETRYIGSFGGATEDIVKDTQDRWLAQAGLHEYVSQIYYCPLCGIRLP